VLPGCAAAALACSDAEIGALAPGLAIASALHETQYTRLFRS
jgi:urease accessory protein